MGKGSTRWKHFPAETLGSRTLHGHKGASQDGLGSFPGFQAEDVWFFLFLFSAEEPFPSFPLALFPPSTTRTWFLIYNSYLKKHIKRSSSSP